MIKHFVNWVLRWQWAVVCVWTVAFYELVSGKIVPWMHVVSNWLIVFVGGMLMIGFLIEFSSRK